MSILNPIYKFKFHLLLVVLITLSNIAYSQELRVDFKYNNIGGLNLIKHCAAFRINIEIDSEDLNKKAYLNNIRIERALDDNNMDLEPINNPMVCITTSGRPLSGANYYSDTHITYRRILAFWDFSGEARYIKLLEGELDVYIPKNVEGTKILIENVFSKYNKNLIPEDSEFDDVEITLLPQKIWYMKFEKFNEENSDLKESKISKYKEFHPVLYDLLMPQTNSEKGNREHMKDYIRLWIKDLDEKILRFEFLDKNNNKIGTCSPNMKGDILWDYPPFVLCILEEKYRNSDTKLAIYLISDEERKVVRFKLENIPLP